LALGFRFEHLLPEYDMPPLDADGFYAAEVFPPPPPLGPDSASFGDASLPPLEYAEAAYTEGAAASALPLQQPDFAVQHGLSQPLPRQPAGPLVLIPLCRKGERGGIERHLQNGSGSVHEVDVEGNTPLHVAVEAPKNEIATVQCLLEYGANINVVNFLGAAPLHYVCLRKSNYRGIANILLENGAVIDCQTLAGKTPLHFACEQQQTELVEVLCHFGADVNIPDVEGNMAIHLNLAKPAGRDTVKRQIIEQLLSCQASFQAPNLEGQMPIHLACRGGYIRCVQLLVEQRADVSSLTSRGETGLHLAVQHNHAEVTQLLLQYHPSTMDLADINGNTPLHICAMHGGLDCAVLLLRMGTDTNARNGQGKSAFDLAKIRGTDLSNTHNAELEQILKDAQKGGGCRQS